MYDPERWADTPVVEQRDPVAAIRAFAAAARAAGYRVIVTPHPNLVGVPGAVCGPHPAESLEDAFLRCGITAAAARVADVVEVQAQYLETDPARYADVVGRAAEQARAANPAALVISGLSTRFATTAETLVDAWTAVRAIVDGHYMAVPEGIRPEVATEFLRQIGASGT
jgi:catechol 2,3-dioxygenase-like lactoylglutathione lyase family enzyme